MRPSRRLFTRAILTQPAILCGGPVLSMSYPASPMGSGASTTHGFMTLFGSIRQLKNGPPLTGSALRGSVAGLDFRSTVCHLRASPAGGRRLYVFRLVVHTAPRI